MAINPTAAGKVITEGAEALIGAEARQAPKQIAPEAFSNAISRTGGGFRGTAALRYNTTKPSDIAHEIYVNNLLANPSTHLTNMFANASNLLLGVGDTATKAVLTTFAKPENKTYYSEALGEAYGMMHGMYKAFKFAGDRAQAKLPGQFVTAEQTAEKLGISPGVATSTRLEYTNRALSAKSMEIDENSITGRVADVIGNIVNMPVQALNASDVAFKVIHDDMAKSRLAMRAVAEGRYPDLSTAYKAMINDPAAIAAGTKQAEYGTFTSRPDMPTLSWITDGAFDKLPGARWIIPFKRTIANLAQQTIERSPLVFASPTMAKKLVSSDAGERTTAQARFITGTAMLSLLAYTIGDHITGDAPRGTIAREQWQKLNGMPFHIQFGAEDKAISLDNLGVMGQLLKSVAMYRQRIDSMSDEELGIYESPESITNFVKTAHSADLMKQTSLWVEPIVDMLSDVYWAESLTGLFSVYDQAQRDNNFMPVYQYLEKIAARTTPVMGAAYWNNVMYHDDPTIKKAERIGDAFRDRMPALRETMYTRYDMLGSPIVNNSLRGPGQSDPKAPYDPDNRFYKRMQRLGLEPSERSKFVAMPSIGKIPGSEIKYNIEEWDRLHSYVKDGIYGEQKNFDGSVIPGSRKKIFPSLEEYVDNVFNKLQLDKAEAPIQRAYVRSAMEEYNAGLKSYMITQDPTFSKRAAQAQQKDKARVQAMAEDFKAKLQGAQR